MPLTKPNINKPVFKTNPTMIPDIQHAEDKSGNPYLYIELTKGY